MDSETETKTNRDDYVKKLKGRIDQWNDDIKKLEKKAEEAGEDMQDWYKERKEVLNQKYKIAQEKLRLLRSAGKEVWSEVKIGVDGAVDDLEEAFKKIKKDLAKRS